MKSPYETKKNTERELPYVTAVEFSHIGNNTAKLLRRAADYLEDTGDTFLSARYTNDLQRDGLELFECLQIFVEING